MLIAHISDTHIVEPGALTHGVAPMADHLAATVAFLNQFDPAPDIVLHSGDITDKGDDVAMAEAAAMLEQLSCPWFVLPGNHDDPAVVWAQFGGKACPARTEAGLDYVLEDYALRVIGMDSTRPGHPGGELTEAQLAWFEARLSEAPERPTILFMHHPPMNFSIPETDLHGFIGSAALGRIIRSHPNVIRIACGHVHLPVSAQWNGTLICAAPGGGTHLEFDLAMRRESNFYLGPPTCLLHHLTGEQALVTHTVTIEERAGPFVFADEQP